MAEDPAQLPAGDPADPDGRRVARAAPLRPEPRSFGSDDMEGVRSGADHPGGRFPADGGHPGEEADDLPSGVTRAPAGEAGPAGPP